MDEEDEGTSDGLSPEQEAEWRTYEYIRQKGVSYKLAANDPAFQNVLIDLAHFCRASETCVVRDKTGRIDEKATFVLEGRREVYLRLTAYTNLNSQELFRIATGKQFNPGDRHD